MGTEGRADLESIVTRDPQHGIYFSALESMPRSLASVGEALHRNRHPVGVQERAWLPGNPGGHPTRLPVWETCPAWAPGHTGMEPSCRPEARLTRFPVYCGHLLLPSSHLLFPCPSLPCSSPCLPLQRLVWRRCLQTSPKASGAGQHGFFHPRSLQPPRTLCSIVWPAAPYSDVTPWTVGPESRDLGRHRGGTE